MKKFLPKTSTNTQGFTLVELLVVIAIIAVLSVIAVTIFGSVQKNARDARRREDVNAIANALEVAKGSATNYPILAGTMFGSGNIPTIDAQLYSYCANSTASNQPADPATWITGATPGTCPANYGAVGTVNPPTGTSFKICTFLEGGSAYCKISVQ